MTMGVVMGVSLFRQPLLYIDKCLTAAPSVIPAQAGIQWFTKSIPA